MKTMLFSISQILAIRQTSILSTLSYIFFRKKNIFNFKNINYLIVFII